MSYSFLVGEMAKQGITKADMSKLLKKHRNSISYKLKSGSFSIEEAEIIQKELFPDTSLKELFKKDVRNLKKQTFVR